MKKVLVYTSLFGNYDELRAPKFVDENIEYLCFTDDLEINSNGWKLIPIDLDLNFSPKKKNRFCKFFPHKITQRFESSIYHDANVQLLVNPCLMVSKFLSKSDFSIFSHPTRGTVQSELHACLQAKHFSNTEFLDITNKYATYLKNGNDVWMTQNRVLIRNHNSSTLKQLMKSWWDEYENGIHRDQISLPICCQKYNYLPFIITDEYTKYFRVFPHKEISILLKFKINLYESLRSKYKSLLS